MCSFPHREEWCGRRVEKGERLKAAWREEVWPEESNLLEWPEPIFAGNGGGIW